MNLRFRIARTRVPVRVFAKPLIRMDLRPLGTYSTRAFSQAIRAEPAVFRMRTVANEGAPHFPIRAGIPRQNPVSEPVRTSLAANSHAFTRKYTNAAD